jgi:hypothetical protein
MTAKILNVRRLQRFRGEACEELEFAPGVNVMIGEPNAGKTKWLQILDYLFGDTGVVEDALGEDVATLYDRARVELTIAGEPLALERRWKEKGGRTKLLVNGEPMPANEFSAFFLQQLNLPVVRIPKGDPYSENTWPELSWRTLLRHLYRREDSWHEFILKQPESDQHAAVVLFLGAAPAVFSSDYARLVEAQKQQAKIEAQKANFEQTVQDVARELVTVEEATAGFTRDSLAAAIKQLEDAAAARQARRDEMLGNLRQAAEASAAEENARQAETFAKYGAQLEAARSLHAELRQQVEYGSERITELTLRLNSARNELAKLERTRAAGDILGPLRVTHCPVCDRSVSPRNADPGECYLCHQPVEQIAEPARATSIRLDFERQQLKEEGTELEGLVEQRKAEDAVARLRLRDVAEEISRLEALLQPVRSAAAWLLPAELTVSDQETGRFQERVRQLQRIGVTLERREELARRADELRANVARLRSAVQEKKAEPEFTQLGDQLADAMTDYLNALDAPDRERWGHRNISVVVTEGSLRLLVDRQPWARKLGAHMRAYLFLAYQYALLKLCRSEPFMYPGLLLIDFPANLSELGISDQENYLLQPFVKLLAREDLLGLQLIAAGRAFADLGGARRIDLPRRSG